MTTTYDPFHPKYFDDADVREEMDRVYDLCHGCRLCFKFCTSFPTLFEFIDQHDDQDSTKMTPGQQDQVVDECFNCKLCYVNCPYTPGKHEWDLDFPRLMLRAKQAKHHNGEVSLYDRVVDQAIGRTDLAGTVGSALAPVANKLVGEPESKGRKLLEKATGISAQRILDPYAKERFSTWMKKRPEITPPAAEKQGDAILFPTCQVEYSNTGIGKDLVKVAERNNIECSLPEGEVCCGAPFLHEGDVKQFRKQAEKNVNVLAEAIRGRKAAGADPKVVVTQPTCGYVLKFDYVDYLEGPLRDEARLVAEHTMDSAEFLMSVHKGKGTALDTNFRDDVPEKVTYHAPCHLRAQNIGLKSRDLIKLTGAKTTIVAECSGIDGMWGLRATNVEISRKVAKKMTTAIKKAGNEVVVGDCTLANGAIKLENGSDVQNPVSFLARAYGIEEE